MKASLLVARRDLGSYFRSPIFFVLTTVFLVLHSFLFFNILSFFSFQSFQAPQLRGMGISMNLNEWVIEPSMRTIGIILLFMVPVITMRSFSEDRKTKSIILLLASPLRLRDIIFGKFLACLAVVGLMLLLSAYTIGFLLWVGEPDVGPIITGFLGVFLMVSCYVSVGIFASSLTDNQIIAAVISSGIIFLMWLIGLGAQSAGAQLGEALIYLSLLDHLDHFLKGIIDSSDVVYYLSFIGLGLFLTHRVLDSHRWR
ncbi:MAG: ABC transporter permease subunit [Nitrospinales bacterium]